MTHRTTGGGGRKDASSCRKIGGSVCNLDQIRISQEESPSDFTCQLSRLDCILCRAIKSTELPRLTPYRACKTSMDTAAKYTNTPDVAWREGSPSSVIALSIGGRDRLCTRSVTPGARPTNSAMSLERRKGSSDGLRLRTCLERKSTRTLAPSIAQLLLQQHRVLPIL
jgi:hypothetical protein